MGNAQTITLTDDDVRAKFAEFDTDANGRIDVAELSAAIQGLVGRKPSDPEVHMLIETVDKSQDGELQFSEFSALVHKYNEWVEGGAFETWERLGEELYELALREPLLPGFLKVLGLHMYTHELVNAGYQTAYDVAYIKPDRIHFEMRPVHSRKLLHCAAVMRSRKPPHLLSPAELEERQAQRSLLFTYSKTYTESKGSMGPLSQPPHSKKEQASKQQQQQQQGKASSVRITLPEEGGGGGEPTKKKKKQGRKQQQGGGDEDEQQHTRIAAAHGRESLRVSVDGIIDDAEDDAYNRESLEERRASDKRAKIQAAKSRKNGGEGKGDIDKELQRKLTAAAIRIQSFTRMTRANRYMRKLKRQQEAATRLQSQQRRLHAKKQANALRRQKARAEQLKRQQDEQHMAATRIQAQRRRKKATKEAENKRKQAERAAKRHHEQLASLETDVSAQEPSVVLSDDMVPTQHDDDLSNDSFEAGNSSSVSRQTTGEQDDDEGVDSDGGGPQVLRELQASHSSFGEEDRRGGIARLDSDRTIPGSHATAGGDDSPLPEGHFSAMQSQMGTLEEE